MAHKLQIDDVAASGVVLLLSGAPIEAGPSEAAEDTSAADTAAAGQDAKDAGNEAAQEETARDGVDPIMHDSPAAPHYVTIRVPAGFALDPVWETAGEAAAASALAAATAALAEASPAAEPVPNPADRYAQLQQELAAAQSRAADERQAADLALARLDDDVKFMRERVVEAIEGLKSTIEAHRPPTSPPRMTGRPADAGFSHAAARARRAAAASAAAQKDALAASEMILTEIAKREALPPAMDAESEPSIIDDLLA